MAAKEREFVSSLKKPWAGWTMKGGQKGRNAVGASCVRQVEARSERARE